MGNTGEAAAAIQRLGSTEAYFIPCLCPGVSSAPQATMQLTLTGRVARALNLRTVPFGRILCDVIAPEAWDGKGMKLLRVIVMVFLLLPSASGRAALLPSTALPAQRPRPRGCVSSLFCPVLSSGLLQERSPHEPPASRSDLPPSVRESASSQLFGDLFSGSPPTICSSERGWHFSESKGPSWAWEAGRAQPATSQPLTETNRN